MTPLKLLFFVCEEGQTRLDFLLNFFEATAIFLNIHRSTFVWVVSLEFFCSIVRVSSPSGCVFAAVGGPNSVKSQDVGQSPTDVFQARPSPVPEEAPFGLSSSAGAVPPAQGRREAAVSWSSHCVNGGSPCDCAGDGVERYEGCFKDGEVLPVPELVGAVGPGTLSFVVADIGTGRLAGIGRETFEDLLGAAGVPGRCFCRKGFAAWGVLLPSEEVARGLAGCGIAARFFRLQPECRGGGGVRVAVCSVSVQLGGGVLTAYLGVCGGVERVAQVAACSLCASMGEGLAGFPIGCVAAIKP